LYCSQTVRPEKLKWEGGRLSLKTTPKNLLAKGKISRLVIQALKEIGNGKVSEVEEKKIIDLLRKEDEKYLRHDILLAPVWIQKIMKQALNDGKN
jgi:hypothetical protein